MKSDLTTYSQYKEDLVVDALLSHKRHGFYVDIGANDPDATNNTKLFYNRGWHGINIEPEPIPFARLCDRRNRDLNLNVGIGPEAGTMTFYRMSADTLSSFNKEAAMQAGKLYGERLISEKPTSVLRLVDIFESHLRGMTIDFMSVDAEGYDLAVLKSNDWNRFRPSLMIVEINVEGDAIIQFLQQHDYIMIFDNRTNGIFISKEFSTAIDQRVRKDLIKLEQTHNLETVIPHAAGKEKLVINFVYGHLRKEDSHAIHRGGVSIIWSSLPINGCDVYVYQNAFSYKGKRGGIDILLTLEPFVVLPGEFNESVWKHFDYVLTLFDSLTKQDKKFRKINFPHFEGLLPVVLTENMEERRSLYPTAGRLNSICMINGHKHSSVPSELYSKRAETAKWFHDHSDIPFDVFGTPPFPLPNYKGPCEQAAKLSTLKKYRYCLCFENTDHPVLSVGYITEKILDCFETRTIPIYLGASNVEKYIPSECFIDFRKFKNFGELDSYLHSILEEKYQDYIAAIDAFVCGGGVRKYSTSALYLEVARILIEENLLDPDFLNNDIEWKPGLSVAIRRKKWKTSGLPVMWTWKHLSKAEPPVLEKGKIISGRTASTASGYVKKHAQDHNILRLQKKSRIKLLIAGIKFSYGNARRGYDYGWWNTIDTLLYRFKNLQVQFFDYATEAQQRGVAGMSDRLVEVVRQEKPDLLFYGPFDLRADILHERLRFITDHTDTQTVIWMSDDHWRFENYSRFWAPCVDYIITTAQDAVTKYRRAGFGQKVIKSQWAFNPFTYQQMQISQTRDVSFVGMAHGNRSEVIHKMRSSGLNVDAFGLGWSEDMDIPFCDMVRIFNQSRINLNLSNSSTILTQQIKGRNFEVPGCRGFLITTPAENLEEYYEPGKEVVIASSIEELIDKSRYYLAHEREREEIARRGYERTLAEHTWTHRFVDIFRQIGFSAVARDLPQTAPSSCPGPASSHGMPGDLSYENTAPQLVYQGNNDDILTSICVMAYNQLEYTKQCVESLLHYTKESHELLLLDNGSSDGTFEYFERVKSFHPNTRVIRNFQNRNVEANANYVYSLARGKYIVSVTNDIVAHDGWLKNLIKQIESEPDIGMAGPRSNNISGPQAAQAAYDTLEAYHTFAAKWSKQHQGENFPAERIVGMFIIIKKIVLNRIGGLDPDLPTNGRDGGYGFSDDDFSLRLRLAGYKSLVANDVFIHHFGSVTVRKDRPDLFGPAQNINKEKYWQKLRQNDRVIIGPNGELALKPYGLGEHIPIAEKTVIQTPATSIVKSDAGVGRLLEIILKSEHDFVFFAAEDPTPGQITILLETALCHPDIAILVPTGDYAPSTHASSPEQGKGIELIKYADLSFCVINLKLVRPLIQDIAQSGNDDEFFWFLQRRIRGEGYFIAKACGIVVETDKPCINHPHPYDIRTLPEQLVREKRYAEASAIYKDDLSKDPTFVESLYQLAHIAKEHGQIPEAIYYAEHLLRIDLHHIKALILLSRIFLEQGDLKRAEAVIRQAHFKQPGNIKVKEVTANYERLKSRSGNGLMVMPKKHEAGTGTRLSNKIPVKQQAGSKSAQERLQKIIDESDILYQQGRIGAAVDKLLAAIKKSPSAKRLYYSFAGILIDTMQYDDALDVLNKMPSDNNDLRKIELSGYCKEGKQAYADALLDADRALAIDARSAPALNLKGMLAYWDGDKKAAEEYFQHALESDSEYGIAYTNLGAVKLEKRLTQEALDLFKKGFTSTPQVKDVADNYHEVISELGAYESAEYLFKEAIQAYPENKKLAYFFIDILLKQNKYKAAMDAIENSIDRFGFDESLIATSSKIRSILMTHENEDKARATG